jgi:shikimate dehydrogenase
MNRLAVFGNPIAHSLSPQLHAEFARQHNLIIDYQKILIPLGGFKKTVDLFRASGGVGANVTAPCKCEAYDYCDEHTERAKRTRTVNTLIFKNNICIGDNTDGVGLIHDFAKKQIHCAGKNILILGAGGATQGILSELILQNPQRIFIFNRTADKAKQIIDFFSMAFKIDDYQGEKIDLLINASAMDFSKTDLCFDLSQVICYDLNYGERHRAFTDWAMENKAQEIHDGLGMLVEQGAESFAQWFGG